MTTVLVRGKLGQTYWENSHLKAEAEIGGREEGLYKPRRTKDGQQPPEAGRGRRDPPLEPAEGAWPCPHTELGLLASRLRENTFPMLEAPNLWLSAGQSLRHSPHTVPETL